MFDQFHLDEKIVKSLLSMKFSEPTQVQMETIPRVLNGESLLVKAATGSGKTAACAIPACQIIDIEVNLPQVLVLVPTRELAQQFATQAQLVGKDKKVKVFALHGGEGNDDIQEQKLLNGVHILVATPGRLMDFIYSRRVNLTRLKMVVLDEADEMLSMGFYDDIAFIFQCIMSTPQMLFFSATFATLTKKLCKEFAPNAHELIVAKEEHRESAIRHLFYSCRAQQKKEKLLLLLQEYQPQKTIIFCKSRHTAENLAFELKEKFQDVDFLHAGLDQKIRNQIIVKFRQGRLRYLIATDVLSRGIDFSDISHVFVFDLPRNADLYVHRSGRTGRYDKQGVSISLVTEQDKGVLKQLEKVLKDNMEWLTNKSQISPTKSVQEKKIITKDLPREVPKEPKVSPPIEPVKKTERSFVLPPPPFKPFRSC